PPTPEPGPTPTDPRSSRRDPPRCPDPTPPSPRRRDQPVPTNRLAQPEKSLVKPCIEFWHTTGRFRRNHCVPMPVVDSIEELNELLEAWDDADDARRIGNRTNSVKTDWALEKTLLRPLPAEPFDTALTLTPRVDRY